MLSNKVLNCANNPNSPPFDFPHRFLGKMSKMDWWEAISICTVKPPVLAKRSSFSLNGRCPLQVRNAFQEMARQQAAQGLHPPAPQQPQLSPPPLQQRAPEIPTQLLDPLSQVRVLFCSLQSLHLYSG